MYFEGMAPEWLPNVILSTPHSEEWKKTLRFLNATLTDAAVYAGDFQTHILVTKKTKTDYELG